MRHLRMVGACLIAAVAVSALGASAAMASKDPYNVNTWGQYKYCPYESVENCIYGRTAGGKQGGEFQYGRVRVPLSKPIAIQGGLDGTTVNTHFFPAVNGGETLEAPPLPIDKGIKVLSTKIQEEAEWPAALKESFKAAMKAKEGKAFAKIEFAGNSCFTEEGCVDPNNLLNEEGSAFVLPLKVTVTNSWLEGLGGGPCTIGNDENPIVQHLTSEGAGRAGDAEFSEDFSQANLRNTELVDVGWTIPTAAAPSGCGGAYESYVDKALAIALEVFGVQYGQTFPSDEKGITWLTGDLHVGNAKDIGTTGVESGEIP